MATNEQLKENLLSRFGDKIVAVEEQFGQLSLTLRRDVNVEILKTLRDDPAFSFNFLMDLFGVDYLEMGGPERFAVVYNLYSLKHGYRLRIKVFIPEGQPQIQSICALWSAANWAEREVYDMYGIIFDGHPNMTRILCPDEFEGHPLRKDFPLKGIGFRERFEKITRKTSQ